jgi:hypothetical protein
MAMIYESKANDQTSWHDLVHDSISMSAGVSSERCSRTFVSFTHLQTYQETFPSNKSFGQQRRTRRRLCPITNMPAQYFDPLTQMPYANLDAFKILRRIYAEEMKKSKRTPSVLIDAHRDVNLNNLR